MARPVTQAEFKATIAEMQKALDLLPKEARICPKCFSMFPPAPKRGYDREHCWCDYESNWQENS